MERWIEMMCLLAWAHLVVHNSFGQKLYSRLCLPACGSPWMHVSATMCRNEMCISFLTLLMAPFGLLWLNIALEPLDGHSIMPENPGIHIGSRMNELADWPDADTTIVWPARQTDRHLHDDEAVDCDLISKCLCARAAVYGECMSLRDWAIRCGVWTVSPVVCLLIAGRDGRLDLDKDRHNSVPPMHHAQLVRSIISLFG